MLRMLLIAGAGMACVGCVSAYAPPPEGAQTASVAFQHDPATASATFQQVLSSVDGPGCEKVAFIGDYHPTTAALGLAGRHEVRLPAGRPVYLLAETYDNSESVVLAGAAELQAVRQPGGLHATARPPLCAPPDLCQPDLPRSDRRPGSGRAGAAGVGA